MDDGCCTPGVVGCRCGWWLERRLTRDQTAGCVFSFCVVMVCGSAGRQPTRQQEKGTENAATGGTSSTNSALHVFRNRIEFDRPDS